ncbi:hypothetical protein SJAV_07360 [Sulfurisphaera javensis]|uniref:Uncharacterized protein n=1 Tax=Sulfurisphaera javensis TaxID=2049879 RepID=A0AAT9GPH5_9CREN
MAIGEAGADIGSLLLGQIVGNSAGIILRSLSSVDIYLSELNCISNQITQAFRSRQITQVNSPPNPFSETIRPAFTFATGIIDRNVELPDLMGHGILVNTKDDYMLYIGRVSPNWTRIWLGQGGFAIQKRIKTFSGYLGNKLTEILSYIQNVLPMKTVEIQGPKFNVNAFEFGVINLGKREDVLARSSITQWINPLQMGYCSGSNPLEAFWGDIINFIYSKATRCEILPFYTAAAIDYFKDINPTSYGKQKSGYEIVLNDQSVHDFYNITKLLPDFYITLKINVGLKAIFGFALAVYFPEVVRYLAGVISYSDNSINKSVIGAPLQSSDNCPECTQYGNDAQIVAYATLYSSKIGDIELGTAPVFLTIPYKDYGNMTLPEIKEYLGSYFGESFKSLIDLAIVIGISEADVYNYIKNKYGDSMAQIVLQNVDFTGNESEDLQNAENVVQMAIKVKEEVKQKVIGNVSWEELRNAYIREKIAKLEEIIDQCMINMFNSDFTIEENVQNVISCVKYLSL